MHRPAGVAIFLIRHVMRARSVTIARTIGGDGFLPIDRNQLSDTRAGRYGNPATPVNPGRHAEALAVRG